MKKILIELSEKDIKKVQNSVNRDANYVVRRIDNKVNFEIYSATNKPIILTLEKLKNANVCFDIVK